MARPINTTPLTTDQQKLAADNIGLAYKFAFKNPIRGVDQDETVSICMMGLVRAARKFNPGRGVRFSTYAYACMRSTLLQHIALQKADRRIINTMTTPFSGFQSSRTYDIADPAGDDEDEHKEMKDLMATALDQIDGRLASVLRLRFFRDLTLEQIGAICGVTKERVRQLEQKALWQLRRILDPDGSEEFSPDELRGLQSRAREKKRKMKNQYLAMAV